jgi:hypothetical protein
MGKFLSRTFRVTLLAAGLMMIASCSVAPTAPVHRLLMHRAMIDFTGLRDVIEVPTVHATWAPPIGWDRLMTKKTALYVNEQWRSPSAHTGVGVAYIKLPVPVTADMITWFAKNEYAKKSDDGRIIAQWTDSLGRPWFECENKKYHVRGYAITRGFEAWIIYSGYRTANTPDPAEISLAIRSAETIIPGATLPTTQPSLASK